MAIEFRHRRGTVAENNAFTGASAEVVVDTTNNRLRVHDGVTAGGFPVGDYVNVKDFGAVGDGVTNDSTAINAALAVGGAIYFPSGNYLIDARLYPVSNSKIFGDGASTKLKLKDNFGTQINMFNLDADTNISFQDLYLDGNLAGQTFIGDNGQNLISLLNGSSDIIIDNCFFINSGKDGVYIGGGSKNVMVSNCTFDTMRRMGVTITSGENIVVQSNIFQNGYDLVGLVSNTGVHFEPNNSSEYCYDLIIDNNIFKDMFSGVTLFNNKGGATRDIIVSNNTFNTISGQAACLVYYIYNVTINGNSFYNNGDLAGASDNSNKGGAIHLRSASEFTISGNIFKGNKGGTSTIYLYSTGWGVITGNTFTHCQKHSIFWNYLYGADDAGVGGAARIITNNIFISGSKDSVGTYRAIETGDYATHYSVADIIENNYAKIDPTTSYGGFFKTYYIKNISFNAVYNKGGTIVTVDLDGGQHFQEMASAAPVSGTYKKGDFVLNQNPTAGSQMGWICTTAGSPGTWKAFGAITA